MVVGIVLVLLIFCAAAFGVYCYFNPEARNSTINAVEEKWDKVKESTDKKWDKVKDNGDELINKAKSLPQEPELPALPGLDK